MVLALSLAVPLAGPAAAQAATKVEEVTSPGGIRAYLISEPSIPFLSLAMNWKGGSVLDPTGKEGTAYLLSGLLDEGAGELDSQAFRTELEDLAIRLTFDADRDAFTGDLRTLTEHRERAFELLRLALTAPRFDAEPVERIRSQVQTSLRRDAEDPDYLASLTWFQAAFPDHPYGRPVRGSQDSVAAITVADLRAFVGARLAKDNLVVGVAGDITAAELAPLLDRAFGGLPATSAPIDIAPTQPASVAKPMVVRRDVPQSQVLFGETGIERDDPDFYAAYVVNHILGGGGFTSRLTSEVREKRGLAYSVYSYLYPADYSPLWLGGLGTSNASVGQALDLVRAELQRMAAGELTEPELAEAKTYLTGSFPLRLTSNDRIAGLLVSMQVEQLGLDYLDRRNGFIEVVTLADVKRVAARLYHPDRLLTVIVGDPVGIEG
jgi:zinc protease